jgi:AraC family transcriptional regulator
VALPVNPPGSSLGRENAVLSGTGKRYFVPDFEGCLSLKAVLSGAAVWEAGGRTFRVNETSYLLLNDRQRYSITIESHRPVRTFCLFFERGYVEDIHRSTVSAAGLLLDAPEASVPGQTGYFEALRPTSAAVRGRLQGFAAKLPLMSRMEWDERFLEFAEMLVEEHGQAALAAAKLPAMRAATRAELYRRLLRGRDALLSSTESRLKLKTVAREAALSPYHFHRSFLRAFGETPHRYLVRHRLLRAKGLLLEHDRSVTEVCVECGFESLPSFSRLFRAQFGTPPSQIRKIR